MVANLAERPCATAPAPAVADIEQHFQPTHDERARASCVSMFRKLAIMDMALAMKRDYEERVAPALAARGEAARDWRGIETVMEREASYRFYSAMRYNAQEMCYLSALPAVERALPAMIATAKALARDNPAGGSLRLNPTLAIPRYVSALDVHLAPGGFASEWVADDVAQGAVVSFGGKVFTGQHPFRKRAGVVGETLSAWIARKFPDFRPRRILDLGTSSGKNLFPYLTTFPGAEGYGVDVGAPLLRFGHALAQRDGFPVHFSQQNAEATDFPDGHFDLVVSSFFFHEVPLKATRRILQECARLLRPGGLMLHMELPNEAAVGAYDNFFWNWDTANNNEPNYTVFRAQDPVELCATAGFPAANAFTLTIPDFAGFGSEKFERFMRGELSAPMHGRGGWFAFGARKPGV